MRSAKCFSCFNGFLCGNLLCFDLAPPEIQAGDPILGSGDMAMRGNHASMRENHARRDARGPGQWQKKGCLEACNRMARDMLTNTV
jgi:hypothetical protein